MQAVVVIFGIGLVSLLMFVGHNEGLPKPSPSKHGLNTTQAFEKNQIKPEARRTNTFNSNLQIKKLDTIDLTLDSKPLDVDFEVK